MIALPRAAAMGLTLAASEIALSLWKRSGRNSRSADRGSLRLIWVVIVLSVTVATSMAQSVSLARFGVGAVLHACAVALFLAGLVLRWYSIYHLGRFFTVDVAVAADHRVVDTGPYKLVRHPSYTGAFLAMAGYALALGNAVSLLVLMVPITAVMLHRIHIEEAALRGALGEEYAAYAARTKRLLPYLY